MLAKINRISIILLLLFEVNFFSLFHWPNFISGYNGYSIKYLSLFLIVIVLITNLSFGNNRQTKSAFNVPIIFLLISVAISTLFSIHHYNQTMYETGRLSYYYIIILLYYFLIYYFFSVKNLNFLITTIKLIGVIYSGILIIQILLYLKTGSFFLDISSTGLNLSTTLDNDTTIFISGIPRIQQPADFIMFSFLITNIELLNRNHQISFKDITSYGIQLSYILFVSQTRMYIIISILLIILLILCKVSLGKRILFGVLIFIGILIFHNYILQKFGFFNGDRVASTLIRNRELYYYIPKIFSNNGLGIGFANDLKYYFINHGTFYSANTASFYFDDIGIIGSMSQLGVLGIISIVLFTYYLIISAVKVYDKRPILFMYAYLMITSVSLSLLNIQRILYLPLILYFITGLLKLKSNKNNVL